MIFSNRFSSEWESWIDFPKRWRYGFVRLEIWLPQDKFIDCGESFEDQKWNDYQWSTTEKRKVIYWLRPECIVWLWCSGWGRFSALRKASHSQDTSRHIYIRCTRWQWHHQDQELLLSMAEEPKLASSFIWLGQQKLWLLMVFLSPVSSRSDDAGWHCDQFLAVSHKCFPSACMTGFCHTLGHSHPSSSSWAKSGFSSRRDLRSSFTIAIKKMLICYYLYSLI